MLFAIGHFSKVLASILYVLDLLELWSIFILTKGQVNNVGFEGGAFDEIVIGLLFDLENYGVEVTVLHIGGFTVGETLAHGLRLGIYVRRSGFFI